MLISGDLSIRWNVKEVSSLVEPLKVVMEYAERRASIPIANERGFLEVVVASGHESTSRPIVKGHETSAVG
jgi:hypothetical protein